MSITTPAIDLPTWTVRTLHSEWVGYVLRLDPVLRDGHTARVGGLGYERFLLALLGGQYLATMRDVDDVLHVGLALPVNGPHDAIMFEIPARRAGVNIDWLTECAVLDIDAALAELMEDE